MHDSLRTIRNSVCFMCLLFIFWGCTEQNQASEKKVMVRKKIVVAKTENVSQPKKADISLTSETLEKPVEKHISQPGETETLDDKPVEKLIARISWPGKSDKAGTYDPKGKIDPFVPLIKQPVDDPGPASSGAGKPKAKSLSQCSRPTPLMQVGLSQLKLVGIIHAASGNRALVQQASNEGYIVKKDMCIGIHSGRVSKILKDRIIIEERFEDYEPDEIVGWKPIIITRERELVLQKPAGT
ncbi:MAG: pilus assembly protein PilP [Desulfobacterales bacterium]|nr:pilus assembly protein PilP [Desulfobacterales bacterium]